MGSTDPAPPLFPSGRTLPGRVRSQQTDQHRDRHPEGGGQSQDGRTSTRGSPRHPVPKGRTRTPAAKPAEPVLIVSGTTDPSGRSVALCRITSIDPFFGLPTA